jgi:uncharacterized repeat protein (TIGR01451 family)
VSRRQPTSRQVGLFVLVLLAAALTPFLDAPAAAFGERVYESNTVISGTSHFTVSSSESVAQSFVATASYRLTNVTLRLRNTGDITDALSVTVRPDAGGVPSSVALAAKDVVIGNTNLGNYDVPFTGPQANLTAGMRYWIVATCASLPQNGYEWHHSNADTYAGGQAKINLNLGGGWVDPPTPTDMYFVTYGQETDANLSASIRASTPEAQPGDTVTFRIYLNNTGGGTAAKAWLNDTQLPGFTYLSDTAAGAGATTSWPSFTFPNVGNGPRSFNLLARVPVGTEPGVLLTKSFTLVYTNRTGALKTVPPVHASVYIGRQLKELYLNPARVGSSERLAAPKPTGNAGSQYNETLRRDGTAHDFDLDPVLARAFRTTAVNVTLYLDSASHDVRNLDINLTLAEWNGVTLTPVAYVQARVITNAFNDYQPFTFAFPGMDHTFPSGARIRTTVRNMGTSGSDAVLAMNSTFASSGLELNTTTYVRIDLIDLRDGIGSTTVWSPKDTFVAQANVSDPFGSSEIAGARINLTTPAGALVVNFTAMALLARDPASPSAWKLFRFTYAPPLSQGTYRATITAIESNGVHDIGEASALVRAPSFSLQKTATSSNARSGDRFTYDIWFNNTGPGSARRVWINDSLPSQLTFLGSSDPAAMTGSYNWTWTGLGSGNYRLSIDVQVKGSLPPIPYFRNYAFLNFSDEKGYSWPMLRATADVAFRGPVISLSKTSLKSFLHSNETITYQITMQNTGDPAQTLWVNDTLPAGLAYLSDTSASLGGTRTVSGSVVYFRFTNMPSLTTWSFSLTSVAAPALVRGTTLTNDVRLNYTNSNGFLLPPRDSTWTVRVIAPYVKSASVTISRNQVSPADVILAVVSFSNVGNEAGRKAWVNLTLDPFLVFLNATLPALVFGNEVRFTLSSVPLGPTAIYLNTSVNATVADHRLLTINGTLTYADGYGNIERTVAIASASVEAAAPRIVLNVTPGTTVVEAAALVFYNIYHANAGSGIAGDVWLTLSLPASFVYVNDTSDGRRTVVGSTYTWHWSNVAPGPKSFSLELQAKTTVLDGTRANLTFHSDYTDVNGNFRPGVTASAYADFIAPRIDMVLTAAPDQAHVGDTVTFTLTMRNLGGSSAHNVWLTDTYDKRFQIVSYTSRVPRTGTDVLNWSFVDFQPGQVETVTLIIRPADGTPAGSLIPAVFEAVYTNSGDTVVGYVRSNTATVTVIADLASLLWIGLGSAVAGFLAVLLLHRRFRVTIEEAFLVYRDGVLVYHLSRSLSQDKDEDVLSGMLTAIQAFVRDAFVYGEHRELHHLDFGDYRILIERGRNVYLAVVYSGKGSSWIRKRVRSVLDHVETAYGSILQNWDGDMDKVIGARDLIREYLLKTNRRGLFGSFGST